jgi:hypothetical protein
VGALEEAKEEIERVVKAHLMRIAEGRVLTARQFLELEEELRTAITNGAAIGERYAHKKITIPTPVAVVESMMLVPEPVEVPAVQTRPTRILGTTDPE